MVSLQVTRFQTWSYRSCKHHLQKNISCKVDPKINENNIIVYHSWTLFVGTLECGSGANLS